MTYEQAMERLEEIIALLSNQSVALDDSLALYAEGTKLADFCSKKLDEAQLRLKTLSQKDEAHE